ncbi:MAG TPA: hypothetical protein VF744_15285 [Beijerinckiaceae bacterium]|jgi:hypothetical protein
MKLLLQYLVSALLGWLAATIVGSLVFGVVIGAGFGGLLLMFISAPLALPLNVFVLPVACLMTIGTSCRPRVIYLVGAVGGLLSPMPILLARMRWDDLFGPNPLALPLAISGTAAGLVSAACFMPILRRQRRNGAPFRNEHHGASARPFKLRHDPKRGAPNGGVSPEPSLRSRVEPNWKCPQASR